MTRRCAALVALVAGLAACGADGAGAAGGDADASVAAQDLDMRPADFGCILAWDQVGRYRITNLLGHRDEALAVARSATGGTYPVGTVIQLVPSEAMVKRRAGFDAATHDWEFFALAVNAGVTKIQQRGTTDVVNAFKGNCLACHAKAEPKWDFVCETTHGCDPLPLTADLIKVLQNSDSRCP